MAKDASESSLKQYNGNLEELKDRIGWLEDAKWDLEARLYELGDQNEEMRDALVRAEYHAGDLEGIISSFEQRIQELEDRNEDVSDG